jgi:hypothetical protein
VLTYLLWSNNDLDVDIDVDRVMDMEADMDVNLDVNVDLAWREYGQRHYMWTWKRTWKWT